MPASPIERRVGLAAVASLVLAVTPTRAFAAPPDEAEQADSPESTPSQPSELDPESKPEPKPEAAEPEASQTPSGGHNVPRQSTSLGASEASGANEQPPGGAGQQLAPEPEVTEVEHRDVPSGGGIAGAIVDPDDPNATRAQSDLEGERLDDVAGVPDRMRPLQAAGWWTTFTAVALATSGGIFAGVAEVRQDQAERIAYGFDLTSSRTTLYGPVASEYERLIDEGYTYQWVARGLIIAGGVTLVASIGLFAADAVKQRKSARASARIRLDPGLGGFTLRF